LYRSPANRGTARCIPSRAADAGVTAATTHPCAGWARRLPRRCAARVPA